MVLTKINTIFFIRAVVDYDRFKQYDFEVKHLNICNFLTLKAMAKRVVVTWNLRKCFSCRSSLPSTTKVNLGSLIFFNSEGCFHFQSLLTKINFKFVLKFKNTFLQVSNFSRKVFGKLNKSISGSLNTGI